MDGEGTGGPSAGRAEVRPSPDERCAECGAAVGHEWVSFRPAPGDPQALVKHFSAIVTTGPVDPPPESPRRPVREFRHPDDVGVFFHPGCAPGMKLSKENQDELAKLLARMLIADYRTRSERWAKVRESVRAELEPPRCQAQVASVAGRGVFTLAVAEWERLSANEGKLVEIDLERVPAGGLAESASVIASLAAECPIPAKRIEVWRYGEQDLPTPDKVQEYLVLQSFARDINLAKFAERASTQDSPALRKHLRAHVFIVKEQADKRRWQPKVRTRERIVFISA